MVHWYPNLERSVDRRRAFAGCRKVARGLGEQINHWTWVSVSVNFKDPELDWLLALWSLNDLKGSSLLFVYGCSEVAQALSRLAPIPWVLVSAKCFGQICAEKSSYLSCIIITPVHHHYPSPFNLKMDLSHFRQLARGWNVLCVDDWQRRIAKPNIGAGKVAFLPGSADSDDEDKRFSGHMFRQ